MSKALPTRPRVIAAKRTFAIVASQYNPRYVQGLIDHATREIYAIYPNAQINLHQVPGAFEIPLIVQEIASKGGMEGIIALGVIIQGETGHAAHIATNISDALMQIGLAHRIPVIHEVLSVHNEQQAEARCLGEEMNRGTEAARTAVQIANQLAEYRNKY